MFTDCSDNDPDSNLLDWILFNGRFYNFIKVGCSEENLGMKMMNSLFGLIVLSKIKIKEINWWASK
jgi:hypothetical protein